MSDDWKAGFHRALTDAIVQGGSPLSDGRTDWGWTAKDWEAKRKVVRLEGIDYARTSKPEDSSWSEFMGTFYTGDTTKVGIDIEVVTLAGTRIKWRYSGTIGELIADVVRGA